MKTIIIIINEEESLRCGQTERLREECAKFHRSDKTKQ